MQPLGKVSIPVNFVEQVTEEVTRIIVANAEVLARQCAEACIRQVLSSSTPVPTLDLEKRTSVDDDPKTLMEVDVLAHQETEAWQSPQGSDLGSDLLQELLPTGSKGRGKGPAGRRPPPKAPGAKASPPTVCRRDSGMSELLQRVAEEGRRKDREESKEIEDLDLSQISPDCPRSRTICQRCEQEIPSEHFESHLTSHSSEILPWLYVGGKRNLDNEKELTVRTGITHVLNLAQEVNIKEDVSKLVTEYNGQRGMGFVYKKIGFGDTPDQDILEEMDGALEFIHDARCSGDQHRVLVNCVQGVSRSAAVVLAYLMKFERRSLQEAYDFLRRQRPIADPRQEFLEQLGRLECQLFGKPTPSLQAEEVFAGRRMLNVDGAPSPVMQEPGHSPEMMHELEALQQVMQSLNSQLQLIGAEADAAAKEVAHHNVDSADGGGGHMAEPPRRDENQTAFVARRYVSKLTLPPKQMDESLPELKRERDACEALLDFMARTAAALLDQRDHLREHAQKTPRSFSQPRRKSEQGLQQFPSAQRFFEVLGFRGSVLLESGLLKPDIVATTATSPSNKPTPD